MSRIDEDDKELKEVPALYAISKLDYELEGAHYKDDHSVGVALVRTPVKKQLAVFIWVHPVDYSTPAQILSNVHLGTPFELAEMVSRHEILQQHSLDGLTYNWIMSMNRGLEN